MTAPVLDPEPQETAGPEFIRLAESAGLFLDPWQQLVLNVALAEDPASGRWRSYESVLIVARQNGKGSIAEALELGWLFLMGEKVLHTSQLQSTSTDAYERLLLLIRETPHLKRRLAGVRRSADEFSITLTNGGYIRFGPRSDKLGRGVQYDKLMLDEALFLTVDQLAAQLFTMGTRDNPQLWFMSSAGLVTSDHLRGLRDRGRKGNSTRGMAYFEWSVPDPEEGQVYALDDPELIAMSNPSVGAPRPKALALESVLGEAQAMVDEPEKYYRERYSVFDEPAKAGRVIKAAAWDALVDMLPSVGAGVFALDVTQGRDSATITAAGRRTDGVPLVEAVKVGAADPATDDEPAQQPAEGEESPPVGLGWVVKWFAARPGARVALAANRPAGALKAKLAAVGADVVAMSDTELARASMAFYDGVTERGFRHLGDETFGEHVAAGRKKDTGDGSWRWHEKTSEADITALIGGSMALHLLTGAGGDPVWPSFRRDQVLVDDVPGDGWPRYWAVRFGVLGPSVWQCWAERPDGALVLEHELYRARWSPEQLGLAVRELTRNSAGEWTVPIPSIVLGDAEREHRRGFERAAGKSVREPRATLADGLAAVGARLASGRLLWSAGATGEADPTLAAAHRPTSTLEELPGYVWDSEKEVPVDGPGAECLRWVVGHVDLRARAGVRFL